MATRDYGDGSSATPDASAVARPRHATAAFQLGVELVLRQVRENRRKRRGADGRLRRMEKHASAVRLRASATPSTARGQVGVSPTDGDQGKPVAVPRRRLGEAEVARIRQTENASVEEPTLVQRGDPDSPEWRAT